MINLNKIQEILREQRIRRKGKISVGVNRAQSTEIEKRRAAIKKKLETERINRQKRHGINRASTQFSNKS